MILFHRSSSTRFIGSHCVLVRSANDQESCRKHLVTSVGDGKASSQVTHGGAGAQPGLPGERVAVVIPLSAHGAH